MIKPVTDGRESLVIDVDWIRQARDRVTVNHLPVHGPPYTLASADTVDEKTMNAIADFLGFDLHAVTDGFVLIRKETRQDAAAQG